MKRTRRKTDATLVYRITNLIAGLPLRAFYVKEVTGVDHVPLDGPAIIAVNHQSMLDHFISTAVIMKHTRRMVRFLAKAELFSTKLTNFLFTNWGQIPVRRGRGDKGAIETAIEVIDQGYLFGIYPEGTRSTDGTLYRGHTGVARVALATGAPVIPLALTNTYSILQPGKLVPRFIKTKLHFGRPLDFSQYADRQDEQAVLVAVSDTIIGEIAKMLGVPMPTEYNPRSKRYDKTLRAKGLKEKPDQPRRETSEVDFTSDLSV